VARLQERLAQYTHKGLQPNLPSDASEWKQIPFVSIDEGAHKYVLISATEPGPRQAGEAPIARHFVVSKRGAAYHRDAAESLLQVLEAYEYTDIRVMGGGRIYLDHDSRSISVFGYSYGFGQADHAKSTEVIRGTETYKNYDVKWSNEGY